jgi:hypothetical protein
MHKRYADRETGEPALTHRDKMLMDAYIARGSGAQVHSPFQAASILARLQGIDASAAHLRLTGP